MFSAISDSVQAFEYNLGLIKKTISVIVDSNISILLLRVTKDKCSHRKGKTLCKITCIYSSQKYKFCTKYQQLKLKEKYLAFILTH